MFIKLGVLVVLVMLAFVLFGCATVPGGDPPPPPPTNGGPMGYPPNPETGMCSVNAVQKVDGICYDEENFIKLCNQNTYSLDQRCAGLIDRPDR